MTEKKNFEKITIILKPTVLNEISSVIIHLVNWLKRRKKTIQFLASEEKKIKTLLSEASKNVSFINDNKFHTDSDLIISLGGDGTLLGICRQSTNRTPPIFGVNMGNLGFITEFSKVEFFDELESVIKGNATINKTPLYKVEIYEKIKL